MKSDLDLEIIPSKKLMKSDPDIEITPSSKKNWEEIINQISSLKSIMLEQNINILPSKPIRQTNINEEIELNKLKTFLSKKNYTRNINLKNESEWLDSDKCFICFRLFDKTRMIMKHHCRINGEPICSDCSKGRINTYRACDICYLRLLSIDEIKDIENNLINQESVIENIDCLIQSLLTDIAELEKNTIKFEEKKYSDLENNKKNLEEFQNEIDKMTEAKKKLEEEFPLIKKQNKNIEKNLFSKKKNWEKFSQQLTAMNIEKMLKVDTLKNKEIQYAKIKGKYDKIAKNDFFLNNPDVIKIIEEGKITEKSTKTEIIDLLNLISKKTKSSMSQSSIMLSSMVKTEEISSNTKNNLNLPRKHDTKKKEKCLIF